MVLSQCSLRNVCESHSVTDGTQHVAYFHGLHDLLDHASAVEY